MDTDDFEARHRRSIRLKDYDYAQNGAYFVTLCGHERACLFGEIDDQGNMKLSDLGEIVQEEWTQTAVVRPYVILDEFIVMPNHFHAISFIMKPDDGSKQLDGGNVGARRANCPYRPNAVNLGNPSRVHYQQSLRGFKSAATKRINELRDTPGAPVWQRNYYEHVIRNESSLNDIRAYIQANPMRWAEDQENPANVRG